MAIASPAADRRRTVSRVVGVALAAAMLVPAQSAAAAESRKTVWDIAMGQHAIELSTRDYVDLACGTHGGPPALPLRAWADFAACPAEADTGLHEVFFRYDDEREYISKALDPAGEGIYRAEGTTEFTMPVIVSALFDDHGFVAGIRLVTDSRTTADVRENAFSLGAVFMSRFDDAPWQCEDRPREAGQSDYHGTYINQICRQSDAAAGLDRTVEITFFRKAGQSTLDRFENTPTQGYFESETRFTAVAMTPVADPDRRLAAIAPPVPTAADLLVATARDCPGCDFVDADLKRADLHGANLAGADLTGANLHAANLEGADLTGAHLVEANLDRANLRLAKLQGADFSRALLYEARLDGASLAGANMTEVAAGRIQMVRVDATGLIAPGADFRYGRFTNATLTGADLSATLLQDTQFARAHLEHVRLDDSVSWRASLTEVALAGATAQRADFTGCDLRDSDLTGVDFTDANFTLAVLAGTSRAEAIFTGATMPVGFQNR